MRTLDCENLTVYFEPPEREAAQLIGAAGQRALALLAERWNLQPSAVLHAYIMTSWRRFLFQAAPWYWQPLVILSLPLIVPRMRQLWPVAGGWQQRFGPHQTIGVKPPWLIARADRSIGNGIFIPERDLDEKVQHITCHELTHTLTSHLRLPVWLHEGIAMLAVDRFFGRPTVLPATLSRLRPDRVAAPAHARDLRQVDRETYTQLYVQGYWLTRLLDKEHLALLVELLARPLPHRELESRVAAALQADPARLWPSAGALILDRYAEQPETAPA